MWGEKKIVDVKQWGTNQWTSMYQTFASAENIQISAIDAPDMINVSNMGSMFNFAWNFNSNINHWDVSHVTNTYNIVTGKQIGRAHV